MAGFETAHLSTAPLVGAPDGSDVRVLLALEGGGMAQFELAPGRVARAVVHRTIEEIWLILAGRGEIWRKAGEEAAIVELCPGVCLTIPIGTHFQFRCLGDEALRAIAVTMPPWPGEGEAILVPGAWQPNIP